MSEQSNAYLEFLERYGPPAGEDGPVLMATEVFGVTLDDWQIRTLRAYGRGERGISIRACHGPGKTFIAAVMVWHQLITRYPQKTVVTAPSRAQLEDALVAEVMSLYKKLPPLLQDLYETKQNRIELKAAPDDSFFSARTARAETPEALQGVHSEHVLLIADEASGVPEKIFEAADGSMSGHNATTVLLSNPTRSSGFFFDTHHKLKHEWFTMHVGFMDSSRVSKTWAASKAAHWGEDSNAYRIRVLGEFPTADDDTIIPFELVESARKRDIVLREGLNRVWGLDVARFGDDANALVIRDGMSVHPEIEEWGGVDLMKTAGRVKAKWDALPVHERPEWILVDVIGLGAGVVDRLRELNLPVRGVNVSETASAEEKYRNLRTELWFKAREWLETRDHKLPTCEGGCGRDCLHEKLASELTVPRYDYTSGGKVAAEAKSEMKKRGHKSPNVAEAFILTFAAEPAGLIHGTRDSRGWRTPWNEPIKRNRVMV